MPGGHGMRDKAGAEKDTLRCREMDDMFGIKVKQEKMPAEASTT